MNILPLTAGDTKPTACRWGRSIAGCSISMQIGYPVPKEKMAVITNPAAGEFQFEWAVGELLVGIFPAELVITDSAGKTETTDQFTLDIRGRIS
jgi:hypothetical protein